MFWTFLLVYIYIWQLAELRLNFCIFHLVSVNVHFICAKHSSQMINNFHCGFNVIKINSCDIAGVQTDIYIIFTVTDIFSIGHFIKLFTQ